MRHILSMLLMPLLLMGALFAADGTQVEVDLKELSAPVRNAIIEQLKEKEDAALEATKEKIEEKVPAPQQVSEWAEVGTNLGVALSEAARAMNTGINEFITSPAGKLTVFVILWKVLGGTFMQLLFGTVALFVLTSSYRRFHGSTKLKTKHADGKEEEKYVKRYDWKSENAKVVSVIVHGLALLIVFLILML